MDCKKLESLILERIPGAQVKIDDPRGDGSFLSARIGAPCFADLSRLDRHRMVYAAIGNFAGETIDRLSIHTFIPKNRP